MEIERLEFKPIQAFLSYSSKDKEIAGQVKENLEKYGIEAFLAHEDIEVSEDWKEVIIKKLEDCEIFIPIISNARARPAHEFYFYSRKTSYRG